jgi:hypothetical protein
VWEKVGKVGGWKIPGQPGLIYRAEVREMKEEFISKNFSKASQERVHLVNQILDKFELQGYDLSLRQLYYQLVAGAHIENSVRSYKNLGSLVNDARLAGLVDWEMIVDRSRHTHSLAHWQNPGEIVRSAARSFRIDKWKCQANHVEVMVEKDALSGVLEPVCDGLDIKFTACKGYPSASILYRMGKRLNHRRATGKTVYILHLGDHDPSGIDMTRDLEERLSMFAYSHEIVVERLALNMDQVRQYNPPENPAKLSDTRAHQYIAEYGYSSWELDALEPQVLADLVENRVDELRDPDEWDDAIEREKEMKDELKEFADGYET